MTQQVPPIDSQYEAPLRAMLEEQIRRRGVGDERVLAAMRRVPRHEFVPAESRGEAYADKPIQIGYGQTISQPLIVAAMTAVLKLEGDEKVLEVGAGGGYQAAILSLLAREVHSIEIHPGLAQAAGQRLTRLGFSNVQVHTGDGSLGLPDLAPFDAILVTAAAPDVPPPLLAQLAAGGRLAIPVGSERQQELRRIRKAEDGSTSSDVITFCRFVPLRGEFGWSVAEWMQP